jgi:hypothetical protein
MQEGLFFRRSANLQNLDRTVTRTALKNLFLMLLTCADC